MDIAQLKMFLDISRLGSYAALSREEGIEPSSISRQIAALETELGFTLFERTTRRLALTEAGKVYRDQILPLVEGLSNARNIAQDVMSSPSGLLRITASVAFGERWLMPRIGPFQARYPDIGLDLLLTDSVVDIASERIDLAIRHAPSVEGSLIISKLQDTGYHVVASPDYLDRFGQPSAPQDIGTHRGIFFSFSAFQAAWKFRRQGKKNIEQAKPKQILTTSSAIAIRRAALDGLGVAMLADWTIEEDLKSGQLIDLFPDYEVSASDFEEAAWIVYPSRTYVPMRLRLFIDHLIR